MKQIDTLILSGGGIKGLAYCGVFKYLEEYINNYKETNEDTKINIDIKRICGVSIGSIFGLLYVLNYKSNELIEEILRKNFLELRDSKISNFFIKYGVDSGDNIITWIETLMIKKGYDKDITFRELYNKTEIRLQILTTNLHTYKHNIFDYEMTPDVSVIKAVRLSISLPFIFTMEKYNNQIHLDGGLVGIYPIYLAEDSIETTLGIKLGDALNDDNEDYDKYNYINNDDNDKVIELNDYVYNVINCLLHSRETLVLKKYIKNTIVIDNNEIFGKGVERVINFKISKKLKRDMIKLGYDKTSEFFKSVN
jgi:NTE family protein